MRYHKKKHNSNSHSNYGDIMAYKRQRNQTISIARWNENVYNLYIEPRTKSTWQAKLNPELHDDDGDVCVCVCLLRLAQFN